MYKLFFYILLIFCSLTTNYLFSNSFIVKEIVVEGNKVYSNEKILEILHITPGISYKSEYIKGQISKLAAQYKIDGYSLINIENAGFDLDSRLIIRIKEGIIADIFIRGLGIMAALNLRKIITDDIGEIFNSVKLGLTISKIKTEKKYDNITYDVIPTDEGKKYYNLFIQVTQAVAEKNLSWSVSSASGNRIKTSIGWHQRDFMGKSTEYSLVASLYWWGSGLIAQDYRFSLLLPISQLIRPFFGLNYHVNKFGRKDLSVGFEQQHTILDAGIQFRINKIFFINTKYECIFPVYYKIGVESGDPKVLYPELFNFDKRFDKGAIEFILTDEAFIDRIDLQSFLKLELNYYGHKKLNSIFKTILAGKKVFNFNFNYLIFETRMTYIFGKPFVLEEEHISGYYLKGFSSGMIYSTRSIQISGEYRFSLYKDIFHICWVTQSSWYKELRNSGYIVRNSNLISLGPGIYVQFKEFIGFIYYNIGLRERADKGEYHFAFQKVF
jgi:hypothetical protein